MHHSADPSRWAQLTYASFDPGNGIGGWQVKDSRGDLTPVELREISAHLVTAFDSHLPLPEYPTPGDIAMQPRRCSHLLAHGGPLGSGGGPIGAVTSGCTLHAVQAGSDSTGRPGNVFSHAVLDREPGHSEPRLRPIELWRSFDLLTPYGTQEVLAAQLQPGEYPKPSGLVGRDLVLDFIFDPSTWRMGLLSVLLDAVLESLYGGRRVVLVTAGPDQSANWIAAVSWCMAASTARRFSWSVYERAARLRDAFDRGVHLACVPRDDVASLDAGAGGVIVLDELETPQLGQFGHAAHRTTAGHEVAATPWSTLVQETLLDAATAEEMLDKADDIADRAGENALSPAWPLAMAHLMLAPDGADTGLAARVAIADAPAGELDNSLREILDHAVIAGLDDTTESAWNAAAAVRAEAHEAAPLLAEYTARALTDVEWLLRDEGVPLPGAFVDDAGAVRTDVAEHARARSAFVAAFTYDDPAALLRAVDLAARVGLLAEPAVRGRAVETLTSRVAPILLRAQPAATSDVADDLAPTDGRGGVSSTSAMPNTHAHTSQADGGGSGTASASDVDAREAEASALLDRVGVLDDVMHRELVPEAIRRAAGDRLRGFDASQPVLTDAAAGWIVTRGLPEPPAIETDASDTSVSTADPLGDELAVWVGRHRLDVPGAGYSVIDRLLRRYGSWYGIPHELRLVDPRHLWKLDELIALEHDHPGGLPEVFLVPHLACSPASSQLTQLAGFVSRRAGTREARIAALRLEAETVGASPIELVPEERLALAETLSSDYGVHFAVAEFGPLVLEAAVLGASDPLSGPDWPPSWLPVVRACAAIPEAAPRTSVRLREAFSPWGETGRRELTVRLTALEVATDPTAAERFGRVLTAQAREIGTLTGPEGSRLVADLAADLLADLDDAATDAALVDAAHRLAAAEGHHDDRHRTELERYVRQRRDDARRSSGDGWFRPFRTRQPKEP